MERKIISAEEIRYSGSLLGLNFDIIKRDDEEFIIWLKLKLERYVLSELEKQIVKEVLGLDKLEERIRTLEAK